MKIKDLHNIFLNASGVSTDTRKIKPNSIFFALKGENFDGNAYAEIAIKSGASYAVVDNPKYKINEHYILVQNTLKTLQDLSSYHRTYLNLKIIALTGSNGKTTTKELFYSVLSQKYNCKATIGNLNNHIGVPLTLLSFDEKTEIGIVEMGANHQQEIELLCEIAKPDIGYITNFGKAHLEGFGGIAGVIKGKSEMYIHLKNNKKIALINTDDKIQIEKSKEINERIEFSLGDLKIKINQLRNSEYLSFYVGDHYVQTNLYGKFNLSNCMASIALGLYLDLNILEIINGLNTYSPNNHRSQWLVKNDLKIVVDTYNANPTSMEHAISSFIELSVAPKYIILGDMFELGAESDFEHQKIISTLSQHNEINVYFIGKNFFKFKSSVLSKYFFSTLDDFLAHIENNKIVCGFLLLKGSRGMKLENILNHL